MKIVGRIYHIGDETQVSASFKRRELVVETEEQYSQKILIEFTQDKCSFLNHVKFNQKVEVSINIKGREWVSPQGETKWFNSIQGWRIDILDDPNPTGSAVHNYQNHPQTQTSPKEMPGPNTEEEHDDLPF